MTKNDFDHSGGLLTFALSKNARPEIVLKNPEKS
jgi:hypothetical protein